MVRNRKVLLIVQAAMIAAAYVALTMICSALGLASGTIQVRISEALCVLAAFLPAAVPGLWLGCFLSNLLTGCIALDVVFGSLATLLGAIGTRILRKHKFLCTLPPVLSNMLIVPFVLRYGYGFVTEFGGVDWSIPFNMLTVGIGETISCVVLGGILRKALAGHGPAVFRSELDSVLAKEQGKQDK